MKQHLQRFFALLLMLLATQGLWAQASQDVRIVCNATPPMPSTLMTYIESPERCFSVMVMNQSDHQVNIYLAMSLDCPNPTTGGSPIAMQTPSNVTPSMPLTLAPHETKLLNRTDFDHLLDRVNANNLTVQGIDKQQLFGVNNVAIGGLNQLPEGMYSVCFTPYHYGDGSNGTHPQAGERACCSFNICNSAQAPEFILPAVGPGLTGSTANTVYAQNPLNFAWTPVTSSCPSPAVYRYQLKIVELLDGQNPNDAINRNHAIFTTTTGSRCYFAFDTISYPHRLQIGKTYVCQVAAITTNKNITITNGGKSSILVFKWARPFRQLGTIEKPTHSRNRTSSNKIERKNNQDEVLRTLVGPKFSKVAPENTAAAFFDVQPGADTALTLAWEAAKGDSITNLDSWLGIYEYQGTEAATTALAPIVRVPIEKGALTYKSEELDKKLIHGQKYMAVLSSNAQYKYREDVFTTTTHTSLSLAAQGAEPETYNTYDTAFYIREAFTDFETKLFFQWGIDSGALIKVTPAEITYPQDLTDHSRTDTSWSIRETELVPDWQIRWQKPSGVYIQDSVKYTLRVAELGKHKTPSEAIAAAKYVYKDIDSTHFMGQGLDTVIKAGKQFVAQVETHIVSKDSARYDRLYDGLSQIAVFKVLERGSFVAAVDTKHQCHPEYLDSLNRTMISPKADSLTKNNVKIKIGDFELVMQNAELKDGTIGGKKKDQKGGDGKDGKDGKDDKSDEGQKVKYYKGDGFVYFNTPMMKTRIKVEFDTLVLNKDFQAIYGFAKTTNTDNVNYVQLGFDADWTEWTDDKLNWLASKYGDNESVKEYYDMANKGAAVLNTFRSGESPVLTMPLCLDSMEYFPKSENFQLSINEMYFSPTTALMNMFAVFNSKSDCGYVPFVATNICIHPTTLFDTAGGVDFFMAKNYSFEIADGGYNFTMKKSSELGNPKDGCYIRFDRDGFKQLGLDASISLGDKLRKVDLKNNANIVSDQLVEARMMATINDWSDWVASIAIDPFEVEGAPGFTFIPTGSGIYYDHSKKQTPKNIHFPKDYFPKDENKGQQGGQTNAKGGAQGGGSAQGGQGGDKDKKGPEIPKEWTGFYMGELSVIFPEEWTATFGGHKDPNKKDSITAYYYGLNGTQVDSVRYWTGERRLTAGMHDFIIDSFGVSLNIGLYNAFSAETDTAEHSWWKFTLDTIEVSFIKSEFQYGRIRGEVGMPIFDGDIHYNLQLGVQEKEFDYHFALYHSDTLTADLWVADVKLEPSSKFQIDKLDDGSCGVNFNLDGFINIKLGDFKYDGVKFKGMGLSNFVNDTTKDDKGKEIIKTKASPDGFDFRLGDWSLASPQHMAKGFNYEIKTLNPIYNFGDTVKLGLEFAGKVSFGGDEFSIGGGLGCTVLGGLTPGKSFFMDFKCDSIEIECELEEIFYLKGRLAFFDDDPVYGDGIGGSLSVNVMNELDLKLAAGFGKANKPNSSDKFWWWYLEGACDLGNGVPIGPVSFLGIGGGFAYNMTPTAGLQKSADQLMKGSGGKLSDKMVNTSGFSFKPSYKSWVAKAGVAIGLAEPNTMNAAGIFSLEFYEGKFRGIYLDLDAWIMTNYKEGNTKAMMQVSSQLSYCDYWDSTKFMFSAVFKAQVGLMSLVDGDAFKNVPKGDAESAGKYLGNKDDKGNSKSQGTPEEHDKSANTKKSNSSACQNFTASIKVPIELSVTTKYRTSNQNGKKTRKSTTTNWMFSIGKPDADHRVSFDECFDFVVFSAKTHFDMYLVTGNKYDFKLPEIDAEVAKFLYENKDKNVKGDATKSNVASARSLPTFKDAGGFALGMKYKFEADLDFVFLYADFKAILGADIALIDTKGQGCSGHAKIGKNNFYAMGQIYAYLDAKFGLQLNLGFWKGKVKLCEAQVGALLQGGLPNPTWAYGMLKVKASLLNGCININTSCEFNVGEVCVPGADPLANVKLLETVTPGYATETDAKKSSNLLSYNRLGNIVSNMKLANLDPNQEVILCATNGCTKAEQRCFKFFILTGANDSYVEYGKKKPTGGYYSLSNKMALEFIPDRQLRNMVQFLPTSGRFEPDALHKIRLKARAYEYRKRKYEKEKAFTNFNTSNKEGTQSTNSYSCYWFNPTRDGGVEPFIQDTFVYFATKPLGNDIKEDVVFTWPYNGNAYVPVNALKNSSGQYEAYIFLGSSRADLLDKTRLSNQGKELRVYLHTNNSSGERITQITNYTYVDGNGSSGSNMPYIKVVLPLSGNVPTYSGATQYPIKLDILLADKSKYEQNVAAALKEQQALSVKHEVTSRNLLSSTGVNNTTSSGTTMNMSKMQYQERKDAYYTFGKDTTMDYKRIQGKSDYELFSGAAQELYAMYFRLDPYYVHYYTKYQDQFSFGATSTSSVWWTDPYGNKLYTVDYTSYPFKQMHYNPGELTPLYYGSLKQPLQIRWMIDYDHTNYFINNWMNAMQKFANFNRSIKVSSSKTFIYCTDHAVKTNGKWCTVSSCGWAHTTCHDDSGWSRLSVDNMKPTVVNTNNELYMGDCRPYSHLDITTSNFDDFKHPVKIWRKIGPQYLYTFYNGNQAKPLSMTEAHYKEFHQFGTLDFFGQYISYRDAITAAMVMDFWGVSKHMLSARSAAAWWDDKSQCDAEKTACYYHHWPKEKLFSTENWMFPVNVYGENLARTAYYGLSGNDSKAESNGKRFEYSSYLYGWVQKKDAWDTRFSKNYEYPVHVMSLEFQRMSMSKRMSLAFEVKKGREIPIDYYEYITSFDRKNSGAEYSSMAQSIYDRITGLKTSYAQTHRSNFDKWWKNLNNDNSTGAGSRNDMTPVLNW